jgi:hypothetical protein
MQSLDPQQIGDLRAVIAAEELNVQSGIRKMRHGSLLKIDLVRLRP